MFDIVSLSPPEKGLLSLAEQLHLTALKLTKAAFGEMNVQTAKHYGNLGRLYQSMRKFEVRIPIESITIKLLNKDCCHQFECKNNVNGDSNNNNHCIGGRMRRPCT